MRIMRASQALAADGTNRIYESCASCRCTNLPGNACLGCTSQDSACLRDGHVAPFCMGTPPQALLDFDLKKHRMSMNVNIVIDDPEELERVRQKEMDITKDSSLDSLQKEPPLFEGSRRPDF